MLPANRCFPGCLLLVALAATAGPVVAQELGSPQAAVPVTQTPPVMDGRVDEGEWAEASCLAGFVGLSTGDAPWVQPQVWVTRSSDALYLAAKLPLGPGESPVARATERDGAVWADDSLEVFIAPKAGEPLYYQFIANSAGCQYDARGHDASWDADWVARGQVLAAAWSVELRIPFDALGGAPGADLWGLNVAWDRQGSDPRVVSWAPVARSLHEPASFGRITFPQVAPAIQIVGPARPGPDTVAFTGTWASAGALQAALRVERLQGQQATEVASETASLNQADAQPFRIAARVPDQDGQAATGRYRVSLSITRAGELVYALAAPVNLTPPVQVRLRSYPTQGRVEADLDAAALAGLSGNTPLAVSVTSAAGEQVRVGSLQVSPDSPRGTLSFGTGDLAPGRYEIAVSAPGLAAPVTTRFEKPEPPTWLGSREGLTDEVLAPWTPVEAQGDRVNTWGREYRFGPLPFPSQVTTAGESVLAGPVTLEVVADGTARSWPATGEVGITSNRPNCAVLETSAAAPGIVCRGSVATEFDGMVRSDFSLLPAGAQTLEHVSLVVPIKEQHAKYLCTFPGSWGSARNAGALPPEGFTSAFKPFVWLGDEDRGFAWFSESDRGFSLADPAQAIRIERQDGVVTLRINMVTRPVPATAVNYTFGFQATPVKPLQPDVWDYRICHHGNYGIENQAWQSGPVLSYPAEGSINLARGTFEAWVRPTFDLRPEVKDGDPGRGRANRNLLELRCEDGSRLGFYWNVDDRGMRVYYRQGPDRYTLVFGAETPWEPGEWHHVALTWGAETVIYLDGERVAAKPHQGSVTADLRDAVIAVGEQPSDFGLDEVRISDTPRTEFDLTRAPVADAQTLLLDSLDASPDAETRATSPERGAPAKVTGGSTVEGRFGNGYELRGGAMLTLLDRLAQLGVRTICFHEHWTDIQNHTSTTRGEELHSLVKACHARGIKLLLYFGYLMSDIAPDWDTYSDEVLVAPRQGEYHRQPDQKCYSVCYRSVWQDFLADGIARMMDEYDIDGVYLDGTEYPWACSNTHHGCGYQRPDGTTGPTTSMFATRDMMRRIYAIVKGRKPDGQVNVHNSTCMTTPTLGWATSSWDGEQFGSIDRGPDALAVLPLDAFRAEFMGRQWGVPAEFLCYNRPYTMSEALAFTLLHDVLVRGSLGGSLEMESKLWHGMDAFGRSQAQWLPYWDNSEFITVGPDESVKASMYSRGAQGAVVVVSNLGKEERVAQVRLNRERLSLAERLQATDMLTGDAVAISDDGALSFPLASFGFRVVWVKP